MLLMELQITFTMFLLKILCNLLDSGKCCFNNFRNVLPIIVLTLREKGGLNQIVLCFHCFLLLLSLAFVFGIKTEDSLNSLFSMPQNIKIYWCCLLKNQIEYIRYVFEKIQIVFYLFIWATPSNLFLHGYSFYWWMQDDFLISCTGHKCYYINLK